MSRFNHILLAAACFSLVVPAWAQHPAPRPLLATADQPADIDPETTAGERTELRRTVVKSMSADPKMTLAIENQFGDVAVSVWERAEIRVDMTIISSADDPQRARMALNAVTLDEQRQGDTYLFRTVIAGGTDTNWKRRDRTNFLRVDYRISMPKTNSLSIKNKFGNTILPDFWAPLSVESSFGNVSGAALNSLETNIRSSFGNVSLRDVAHGTLTMSFGDLDINSGNVLTINQTHGKLNIGEANRVEARTSYGEALIGAIKGSGKFKTNYARQFRVGRIGPAANQIDVESNYSSVALPLQSVPNCDFNVTMTNGTFNVPELANLRMTVPPPTPPVGALAPMPPRPPRARHYAGQVGTGAGPRIRVVATYGEVRFNK